MKGPLFLGPEFECSSGSWRILEHPRSGLSQRELAEVSGVGRVPIARIEAASQSPRLETVQRLASAMGYPIQVLMMDDWEEVSTQAGD